MGPVLRRLAVVSWVASLLGLGACASTPSHFYVLNALSASETMPATVAAQSPVIGVGPITLPKYLDRPQIVTRVGRHQLALAEFDRWAEPLQDNVLRVLAENLAFLIPTDQVLLHAWPQSATLDYQVTVDMLHFDVWLGGESILLAHWSTLDCAELPLLSQQASLNVLVGGGDYEAMVAALSELLARLSGDIAVAIQRLASRVVAHE
jgi:uncharacterized protein